MDLVPSLELRRLSVDCSTVGRRGSRGVERSANGKALVRIERFSRVEYLGWGEGRDGRSRSRRPGRRVEDEALAAKSSRSLTA